MKRPCFHCGAPSHHHFSQYCVQCSAVVDVAKGWAGSAVAKAIRIGAIPKASALICTDCGAPAAAYDHRDYSMPLFVDPVCRSCNIRRGPALLGGFDRLELARIARNRRDQMDERIRVRLSEIQTQQRAA